MHLGIVVKVKIVMFDIVIHTSNMTCEMDDNVGLMFFKDGLNILHGAEITILSCEINILWTEFL